MAEIETALAKLDEALLAVERLHPLGSVDIRRNCYGGKFDPDWTTTLHYYNGGIAIGDGDSPSASFLKAISRRDEKLAVEIAA